MRRACCDSNFFTSSAIGLPIASMTAFFVISLNSTRWMFGLSSRTSSAMCQAIASPSRSGSGASSTRPAMRGRRLDLRQHLLLRLDDDVLGLEAVLDVDAHLLARQILDVPDRRLHDVAAPEVLLDRLRLRGRLDDHQRVVVARAHQAPPSRPSPWPLGRLLGLGRLLRLGVDLRRRLGDLGGLGDLRDLGGLGGLGRLGLGGLLGLGAPCSPCRPCRAWPTAAFLVATRILHRCQRAAGATAKPAVELRLRDQRQRLGERQSQAARQLGRAALAGRAARPSAARSAPAPARTRGASPASARRSAPASRDRARGAGGDQLVGARAAGNGEHAAARAASRGAR